MTGRCLVSGDEAEGRQNTVTEGRGLKLELGGGGSEVNVGRGGGRSCGGTLLVGSGGLMQVSWPHPQRCHH